MPDEREELELRRRLAQGDLSPREELEIRRTLESPSRRSDTLPQSFNRGVVDFVNAPVNLLNMGLRGAQAGLSRANVAVGGEPSRGDPSLPSDIELAAERTGIVGEQPADTLAGRAAEIAGSSILPTGAMIRYGQQAANPVLTELSKRPVVSPATGQGATSVAPQSVLTAAGQAPGMTVAGEGVASATAAFGGKTAEHFTDDPTIIALGEVAGGFTPAVLATAATRGPTARAARFAAETVAPFTRAGAEPRAARRLQSVASDPEAAARAIAEGDPNLPPARRTEDRRLLALEREVLERDPELDAQFSDELRAAMQAAEDNAREFGGDPGRARTILRQGRDHLLNLLRVRASRASEQAQREIEALGTDATPRQISAVARNRLDKALGDARAQEKELWGAIDRRAPADLVNARSVLDDEIASRSRFDDPEDIPGWLRSALKEPDPETAIPLAVSDVQAIRSRALEAIRAERAKEAPNRNKIRILTNVQEALLGDLGAVDAEGVDAARAFSRELNERFTQGRVGQLLGFQRTGGQAVSPEDTLDQVLTGRAGTNLNQFLRATPDARGDIAEFLKARYLEQVVDGGFNQRAHNAFVRRYGRTGVWETLPGLEQELRSAGRSQNAAQRLAAREERVNRLARDPRRSRAALYLDAPLGEEMQRLLRSRNPVVAARSIRRRVGDDKAAVQGLKQQFVDELLSASQTSQFDEAGNAVISGNRLNKLLNENRKVATALGMDDAELARLGKTIRTFRQIEMAPAKGDGDILSDTPATILNFLARLAGAQSGQRAAQGMGSSLVMAQFGSERMRAALQRLTNDTARQLVIEAQSDPELYRTLLTRSTDRPRKQEAAARRLNAWLAGVASQQTEQE